MSHRRSGYVLVLTIMIIAVSTLLVSSLIYRSFAYRRLSKIFSDREQAQLCALNGIQVGMGMITPEKKDDDIRVTLLLALNKWNTFILTEDHDGMDGKIEIFITSEQGKFALNSLYNFKQKKFAQEGSRDGKKIIDLISQNRERAMGENNFAVEFEQCLKERNAPFDDVTQLLLCPAYRVFAQTLFVQPGQEPLQKEEKMHTIFLTDLFSTVSAKLELQPLFITDSVAQICGLKAATQREQGVEKQVIEKLKKGTSYADRAAEWDDLFAPLYGKRYADILPVITALFAQKFEANAFSVVSYGTIGSVTQGVCAVIEKDATSKDVLYRIVKMYWL